ncbi:MAG: hypothetical protein EOP05_18570, partial [Proteobacteria bacterium]
LLLFFGTFLGMEAVAYFAHKYLFHGVLWFLHKSHHEPRAPGLELNDIFGPFFAIIAIVLIGGYAAPEYLEITRPIGAGMTLYGAVYFFIHDMYTHRRFWKIDLPSKWLSTMRSAHRHHHSNIKKEGQEPFGFVFYQTFEPKRPGRFPGRLVPLIALLFFSSCATIAEQVIQEPKVELQSVKLRDIRQTGGTILIGVEVDNPNPFGITLDGLTYELELAGKPLSQGELKESAKVDAKAKSLIEIPVPVKFGELYSSVLDFVQKKSSAYRVKGQARFGFITLPFDKTGEMKLK